MKIAILPGDGIGTEIIAQAQRAMQCLDLKFETETAAVGGAAYEASGHPLPEATLKLAKEADEHLAKHEVLAKGATVEMVQDAIRIAAILHAAVRRSAPARHDDRPRAAARLHARGSAVTRRLRACRPAPRAAGNPR